MKTILLTGPARGLGLAISQRLVNEGYRVIGISRQSTPEYDSLQLVKQSGEAHFISYDLECLEGIPSLILNVTRRFGPLFGVVNNAGLGGDGLLATMHASDIARTLRVNLEAAITITKYGSRSMLRRREGRIVNVSSIVASTGYSGLSVYAATKAGLEGFSRSLSRELGRVGITVNCVAPGYMETAMTASLQASKLDSIRRRAPVGLPRPDDAATAVAYLLSPEAQRITGTVITVDGGSSA